MKDHGGKPEVFRELTVAQRCRAYFELTRLHKFPLGNILVIWPCGAYVLLQGFFLFIQIVETVWGATMAACKTRLSHSDLATEVLLYILGGTVVHSTACVINDICDIEFDRKVERSKNRPLAAGRIALSGAVVLLSAMVICCVGFLCFLKPVATLAGLFGIFPLHGLYPLMKRWTYWPQAWLGVTLNWGFLVAWLNSFPHYTSADVKIMGVMLFGTTCWTIVYDTEYACQDRRDDAKAGVKSTALLFGEHVRVVLIFFAAAFVAALIAVGMMNGQTKTYFLVACGGTAAHFVWQFLTWDIDDPVDCGAKFKANGDLGYIVFAGILLDYLVVTYQ